jgi:FkbM family methyltransferase
MKNLLKKILKYFNLAIINYKTYQNFEGIKKSIRELIYNTSKNTIIKAVKIKDKTKSENFQDLLVLVKLNFKKRGFFVEFGAGNGIDYSNTYLLEKKYLWNGIICEPAKIFHNKLKKNRRCFIEKDAIWHSSNNFLEFNEDKNPHFSHIKGISRSKYGKGINKSYKVKTISLIDMLNKYNAPKIIDFLSIDTEGSEFKILKNFNFEAYKFRVICIEHNYISKIRKEISMLLKKNGYRQVFYGLSDQDDFFVIN